VIRNTKEKRMSNKEIAHEPGISWNTVSKELRITRVKERQNRKRGSRLDPCRDRIGELIEKHNLSAVRILEDIHNLGYNSRYTILKEYCTTLRKDRRVQAV